MAPNLGDYARACAEFSWDAARGELDGLPGGLGLNIAYEAVDRHVAAGHGDRLALRWLGKRGGIEDYTYATSPAAHEPFRERPSDTRRGSG